MRCLEWQRAGSLLHYAKPGCGGGINTCRAAVDRVPGCGPAGPGARKWLLGVSLARPVA